METVKEFAMYRGEEMLALGTLEEIAEAVGIKKKSVYWHTTKAAQKRLKTRKNPQQCTTLIELEEGEDDLREELTEQDRKDMIETLLVLGNKSEEYYEKCNDTQLAIEYDRLTGAK